MKKRIASLLACGMIAASAVAGLTACGESGLKLTVWGSEAQQAALKQMVAAFEAANPETKYNIKIGVVGEDTAYAKAATDVTTVADVYGFASDQLAPLLRAGALAEVGGMFLEQVNAEMTADSVSSGKLFEDGALYGYPYASDNGYFMYYDKAVLNESEVGSLETIISKCKAQGKKIGWALDDSWYTAGWFFSFGCSYDLNYTEQFVETDITIDFNNENGVKASKAMETLVTNGMVTTLNTNNDTIVSGFGDGTIAAAVSGTWNAKAIQEKLGDRYGVCKLPTVNDPETGDPVQLWSFKGYKLYGVNPTSKNLVEAHKLAAFLASEDMQKLRFETNLVAPTNKVVAALPEVTGDVTLAALSAQYEFAKEQKSVPSNFWDPIDTYGGYIIKGIVKASLNNYKTELDKAVNKIIGVS